MIKIQEIANGERRRFGMVVYSLSKANGVRARAVETWLAYVRIVSLWLSIF